jgi:hypothetical protein
MKLKSAVINFAVFMVSIGVALLIAECVARFVFNPSDLLKLETVGDDILGAVPSPSALAGFDKWGFRNRGVPETVDIVAVRDSHTYGNTARMVEAWPYVLGELSGRKVYNMGLGGSERSARSQMFDFLGQDNIAYVDTLPTLQKSVGQGLYARTAGDMHPGKNGYRVIGEAVADRLKQGDRGKPPAAANK